MSLAISMDRGKAILQQYHAEIGDGWSQLLLYVISLAECNHQH